MRRVVFVTVLLALVVLACSSPAGPTAAPGQPTAAPGQPTAAPGQPTAAPAVPTPTQPVSQPPAGGGTVVVTLTGGTHAGTYTGSADPLCSNGFVGEGVWGTQYSIFEGTGPNDLSSVQLIFRPEGGEPEDVRLKFTIGIGPIFDTANGYTEYDVEVRVNGEGGMGSGSAEVNDAGATATIHATGTTEDGVGIDATVNCPSVQRG